MPGTKALSIKLGNRICLRLKMCQTISRPPNNKYEYKTPQINGS